MLRIPHSITFTGYFEDITSEHLRRFCATLMEIERSPESYFSLAESGSNVDMVDYRYRIFTETETLQSESTAPTIFNEFVEVIGSQEWYEARFVVEHGRRTANLGLRHVGAHLGESLEAVFDKEVGSCFVKAHFKDNEITENFLNRLYQNLELAEKPKKASRYIPEQLETKLLCDSMHLCNVCCEPDIILHHIIPVENGGSTVEENLVVLCLKHHHYAHARFSLTKSFQPQHLREYKRRHLEWVASRGTKGTGEMPVTSE